MSPEGHSPAEHSCVTVGPRLIPREEIPVLIDVISGSLEETYENIQRLRENWPVINILIDRPGREDNDISAIYGESEAIDLLIEADPRVIAYKQELGLMERDPEIRKKNFSQLGPETTRKMRLLHWLVALESVCFPENSSEPIPEELPDVG